MRSTTWTIALAIAMAAIAMGCASTPTGSSEDAPDGLISACAHLTDVGDDTGGAITVEPDEGIASALQDTEPDRPSDIAELLGDLVPGGSNGEVHVTVQQPEGVIDDGVVELRAQRVVIDGMTTEDEELPFAVEYPPVDFGTVEAALTYETTNRGRCTTLEMLRARGPDIRFDAWGVVLETSEESRPELHVRFQVDENYVIEHNLQPLLQIDRVVEAEHDGWYGFEITGSFDDMKVMPSEDAARAFAPAEKAE